jgi:hypothetical protein
MVRSLRSPDPCLMVRSLVAGTDQYLDGDVGLHRALGPGSDA